MKTLIQNILHRIKELRCGKYIHNPVDDTYTLFCEYYKRNK
jgi:hypothetical protein